MRRRRRRRRRRWWFSCSSSAPAPAAAPHACRTPPFLPSASLLLQLRAPLSPRQLLSSLVPSTSTRARTPATLLPPSLLVQPTTVQRCVDSQPILEETCNQSVVRDQSRGSVCARVPFPPSQEDREVSVQEATRATCLAARVPRAAPLPWMKTTGCWCAPSVARWPRMRA